ncbi:HU family DNA-binding protein [Epilithonimonas sp.]|uniref:HU family DNA-binding protein n=1 Tax=Epilithonimonas sp. TaxID=2894511 RepID=UPI002899516C|nr:HU family DNA-binding protein [Epilithonimonas sp.]
MSIQYKLYKKPEPGVAGGGNKKWYANAFLNQEVSIDDLVAKIEKFSTFSEADIRGVLIAMENVVKEEICNGNIVRLDVLGSFYPSLSSEGVEDEKDFTAANVKNVKIIYRPGKRITKALSQVDFKKKG